MKLLNKLHEIAKEEGHSRVINNITSNYNRIIKKVIESNLDDSDKDYLLKALYDKVNNNIDNSKIAGSTLTHLKNYLYAKYRSSKLTNIEFS